jgi:hypothetical protein
MSNAEQAPSPASPALTPALPDRGAVTTDGIAGHGAAAPLAHPAQAPLLPPGRPGNWPRPSTSFRPARSEDEKRSLDLEETTLILVV